MSRLGDDILKLARETAITQDGGEAFMEGLAVLAERDVHEILIDLAGYVTRPYGSRQQPRVDGLESPSAWEHLVRQSRRLASAAAVVADQKGYTRA